MQTILIRHAYYLKENSTTQVYEGVISFDQVYDRRRRYLHGCADTGHHYDVKLVLEDHDSIFIYGIETDDDRRFHIALHYPTFKSATKYTGGVGILTRLDGDNDFVAQRVVLSEEKIMLDGDDVKKALLKVLVDNESKPRVWVSTRINNAFRNGTWMEE